MKLASIFSEDNILINELAGSKTESIRLLMDQMIPEDYPVKEEDVLKEILEREEQNPCLLGEGVSVPHAKIDGLDKMLAGLITSFDGLELDDAGGEKINLLFLILVPGDQNSLMLQALAAVARLCHSKDNREALSQIKTASRIIRLIEETGIEIKKSINTADLMHTDFSVLKSDMTLEEAAEALCQSSYDGLPVVDDEGLVIGEVTSAQLLKVGLPDYVDLLTDDNFLSNFEPFEQYFEQEGKLTVADVMSNDIITAPLECPIIKVAHQMVQQGNTQAYIVSDKKLAGIIYRRDFLTRVLQV